MHAQTTSEKTAMGWHLDGRASAVIGTHTHVATADERVLPGGTAFITDCGMTGVRDSVVGADRAAALRRFMTQMPGRLPAAKGTGMIQGALVEIDERTGRALSISRVSEGGGA
jgi:calcineurin-like phosphoesterase